MTGTERYGRYYWCIKTDVSENGEIYVMADKAVVGDDGSIQFIREEEGKEKFINLAIAPGKWTAFYAASVIDGAAVAVEHWKGEVVR